MMGPDSKDHADQAGRQEALRRRVLGLILGGVLSAAIGWGLNGGWQWFKLLGVAALVIVGLVAVLPTLLLRFMTVRLASWQRVWTRYVAALAALLLLVALGLGPTWLIDSLNSGLVANVGCDPSGEHVLRAVHQYALAQGWQGYRLETVPAGSCYTAARVHLPGGQMRSCQASIPISYPPNRNEQPEITVTCSP